MNDSSNSIGDYGVAAKAYREIKKRIIDRHYAAGQKLSEVRLATELGLGRSPIRTALARLQGEGWIAVSPQSGTYVRGLTKQEIHDILEFRIVLESYVAGLAATRISDAQLARLRMSFDEFGPKVTKARLDEYLEFDMALHVAVYNAAGNALIKQNLLNLIDKVRWIRRGSRGSLARVQGALDDLFR